MKKLLLGSAALTLFSISIILFQISCKKEAIAQSTSNNCIDAGIVNFTINFPQSFNPNSTNKADNVVYLRKDDTPDTFIAEYHLFFTEVGSTKLKIFTIKNIVPGTYKWRAEVRKTDTFNDYVQNSTFLITLVIAAGQTYNITINAEDFKPV